MVLQVIAAHQLKGDKGTLVFRPDEINLLNKLSKEDINILKKENFIGVHFSTYSPNYSPDNLVDFYMAPKGGVLWQKNPRLVLDISSRNFIPEENFLSGGKKNIDLLFISNISSVKKTREFFKALAQVLSRQKDVKACAICPIVNQERSLLKEILKIIESEFQMIHASNLEFLFLERHGLAPLYPLHPCTVANYMRRSRVFCHFSEWEGESRVITEACAAECYVVANKQMKGAGLEPLNMSNSILFNDYESAHIAMLHAIHLSKEKRPSIEHLGKYRESSGIRKLASFLQEYFYPQAILSSIEKILKKHHLRYDICGHGATIPTLTKGKWYLGTLQSVEALVSYMNQNLSSPLTISIYQARQLDKKEACKSNLKRYTGYNMFRNLTHQ